MPRKGGFNKPNLELQQGGNINSEDFKYQIVSFKRHELPKGTKEPDLRYAMQ